MLKRWLIRGTLLTALLLTLLSWFWSSTHRGVLRYTYSVSQPNVVQMAELDVGMKHGILTFTYDGDCGYHPGWRWEIADAPPAENLFSNFKGIRTFAGFALYQPVPYVTSVGIPFSFLSTLSALALIIAWHRTRPRIDPRRSFPVQPSLTPTPPPSASPTPA